MGSERRGGGLLGEEYRARGVEGVDGRDRDWKMGRRPAGVCPSSVRFPAGYTVLLGLGWPI
jgi:hypothetical protein